ncbi:hypothetical protein [Aureivirga sp. CE67]|uniref:hypothetical protein n=1 Tax=Aureivirga sp. CE67 TaxID=1788983 RepID=UPI0018CB856D|nr:hypothetical protein [Aureivirga sp. CE67]
MNKNYLKELENLSVEEFSNLVLAQDNNWKNKLDIILYYWKLNGEFNYELRVKLLPKLNEIYNGIELTEIDKYLFELVFLKVLKCELELSTIVFDSYNRNSLYSYSRIASLDPCCVTKFKFISDLKSELIFNLNQMNLSNSLKNLSILQKEQLISEQQKETYIQAFNHIETYNSSVLLGELSGEIFLLKNAV